MKANRQAEIRTPLDPKAVQSPLRDGPPPAPAQPRIPTTVVGVQTIQSEILPEVELTIMGFITKLMSEQSPEAAANVAAWVHERWGRK